MLWPTLLLLLIAPSRGEFIGTASTDALVSPSYLPADGALEDVLATLALTGLANRQTPYLWLNSSAVGWTGTPVMWPYPEADDTWLPYLQKEKGISFATAANASICTLLSDERVSMNVKGVVLYDDSAQIDALKWLAVTAAGLFDGIPVTAELRAKHKCLIDLAVVFTIPSTFATDLAAYEWGKSELLPLTSKNVLVGACHSWSNYTCGWGDPLGIAAIDYAVAKKGMVINLSPDTSQHPDQAAVFSAIAAHLGPLSIFSGWAEPESGAAAVTAADVVTVGAVVVSNGTQRLPSNLSPAGAQPLDQQMVYVAFQTNEGDTPKNAYSFRGGDWLSDKRGKVPVAWGVAPIIAKHFPGLWEYYAATASSADQFFGATGGVGYSFPWMLNQSEQKVYFSEARQLFDNFMPEGPTWVDLWEGGCPGNSSINPCDDLYTEFHHQTNITGFSQQPTLAKNNEQPNFVLNEWLADGTPVFVPPKTLWYPQDKHFCNSSLSLQEEFDCIEKLIRAAANSNTQRPLFILTYGVANYVDVALEMTDRLETGNFSIIGVQDLAKLGRDAHKSIH